MSFYLISDYGSMATFISIRQRAVRTKEKIVNHKTSDDHFSLNVVNIVDNVRFARGTQSYGSIPKRSNSF